MDTKLVGGILLIVGTAIGGGMLALPMATAATGFWYSTLLLFGCWLVMTIGAFLILEVNLWLPAESNLVSMSKATLGRSGEVVAWAAYLLLLYSLIAAYIAGGGDFFRSLLTMLGIKIPNELSCVIVTLIFGYIVYHGIRSVDYVNRGLMITKFGTYLLLVIFVMPFVSLEKLSGGTFRTITAGVTVAITSFGYATIVPSLRAYFQSDVVKLRKAIVIGSLIPLFFYILWDLVVMGVIARGGDHGLIAIAHSGHSNSDFVNTLSSLLNRGMITASARIFTSICLATSFLGVALCLSDFLADGLGKRKKGKEGIIVFGATFIPPLLIVLFYPGAFITALNYAGIYCAILLVLLPALMVWGGRYHKKFESKFRVKGGKILLIILIIAAVLLIFQGIADNIH